MTLPALRRGVPVLGITALGIAVLGLALSATAHLWWGETGAMVCGIAGAIGTMIPLVGLYDRRSPIRFGRTSVSLGITAVIVLYAVNATASVEIAMTMVGVDTEAVVDRTWTTQRGGSTTHHCTLRHIDGAPIPDELMTDCRAHRRGETIPVVLDPQERFPPVKGPKSDLPVVGQLQVAAVAGLVFLAALAGLSASPPVTARRKPPASTRREPARRKAARRKARARR